MRDSVNAAPILAISIILSFFMAMLSHGAPQIPDKDILIKARSGLKLQPVPFSHATHIKKQKMECAACHHVDASKPKPCTTCHAAEDQETSTSAKEPFHEKCRTCHTEQVSAKCHYCHHKPNEGK
jgi:hypothetical protein